MAANWNHFTEQDTVDTLILPWLTGQHGFPKAESLDYQAQHTLQTQDGTGRYDGLYLSGGFPYAVLEAKRYSHELTEEDAAQARAYATSDFFDKPVPFIVVSNGRQHQFFKLTSQLDPTDGRPAYGPIPPTDWLQITQESPGEVRQLLSENELLHTLRAFKERTYNDVANRFRTADGKIDPALNPQGIYLENIVKQRQIYAGDTTAKGASKEAKRQQALRQAIDAVALHFTLKILFIKLIEDLARGVDSPRIIHTLFPQRNYDRVGGLFGYKVLNGLSERDEREALRLYAKSSKFYREMAQDIAKVSWQDIFRYGFNVHTTRFGKLFRARDYDRFLPEDETLAGIRERLINIDIRTAVIYGSAAKRSNVVGDIYERLIDDELRTGLGAVYTPDLTMRFMIDLAELWLGGWRGKKVVEPACGSGHFYREIYRRYVDAVVNEQKTAGAVIDAHAAHLEALEHVYGRDIDPFAVQLTLLSIFLEQLKDNIRPAEDGGAKRWPADFSVDTQNSLDPITINPIGAFGIDKTMGLTSARSLRASCLRALNPDLLIGNPPYGVAVVPGDHYESVYTLRSSDSYGYFIVNALHRLPVGGRMIFIVSSSFLTIGTHLQLRKEILKMSRIVRVIKLNRHTFPGVDIFPVVIELERCDDAEARDANFYQFYDLWRFNPNQDSDSLKAAYAAILADPQAQKPWPFEAERSRRYTVRQGIIPRFSKQPIFEGRPSLYDFMADVNVTPQQTELMRLDGTKTDVPFTLVRGRKVYKLARLAETKIGLQSGDNRRFYRAATAKIGGARYQAVPPAQIVGEAAILNLTDRQRSEGIEVNDPENDCFYVPLDKSAEADIEGGILAQFQRPVDFYIDWSEKAVADMKALSGARFQNSQYYFRKGISFSNTGLYSPTYRFGHGAVFDQTGSAIFSDFLEPEVLMGLLTSTLMRYFVKSFIDHGVHARLDDLPIVLPDASTKTAIKQIIGRIVQRQKQDEGYDYRPDVADLDKLVETLYGLDPSEVEEVHSWFARHYPKLVPGAAPDLEEAA